MTTATVNRLRRTANPTAVRMNPVTRFQTCMSAPPSLLAPRGIRSAGNLVLPRRVRSPARRMPSNAGAWKMRPPRRGVAGRLEGKMGAVRPGSGETPGNCDGEMRIDLVPNAGRKCLGECNESCQSLSRTRYGGRGVRPGELRREASDRTAKVIAEPTRVEGERGEYSPPRGESASRPAEAVRQMCRAGRSDRRTPTQAYVVGRGAVCTPPKQSRRSKRRSGEQCSTLLDRLTLREALRLSRTAFGGARLNPSGRPTWEIVRGAKLDPTRKIPGSETEPPGFSGVETLESQTVKPLSGTVLPVGKGFGDFPLKPVATLCQDFATLEQHFAKGDYHHRPRGRDRANETQPLKSRSRASRVAERLLPPSLYASARSHSEASPQGQVADRASRSLPLPPPTGVFRPGPTRLRALHDPLPSTPADP